MWIHYCTLHSYRIESDDGRQQQSVTMRLSTVVYRDIISDDLLNLAMPNCLADNITGYPCDPYGLLRVKTSVFFMLRTLEKCVTYR